MELLYLDNALKQLDRLQPDAVAALRAALKAVAAAPFEPHGFVKPMTGRPAHYRLRKGDYRAIYRIENQTVIVVKIGHRKDVYE